MIGPPETLNYVFFFLHQAPTETPAAPNWTAVMTTGSRGAARSETGAQSGAATREARRGPRIGTATRATAETTLETRPTTGGGGMERGITGTTETEVGVAVKAAGNVSFGEKL